MRFLLDLQLFILIFFHHICCDATKHQYKFLVCEKLRLKLLALFSLRGISTSEHLLELFGTSGLSYVITLQRQLAAHDLDEVFRKQTCRRQEMLKQLKITTFRQLASVRLLTVAESQTSHNGRCYHEEDKDSTVLPSGSALLKLRAVMMLFTSLSILLATPGYWRSRCDGEISVFHHSSLLCFNCWPHLNLHGDLSAVLQSG